MANIPVNYASINDTEAYFELLKNNNSNEVDERFIPLKGDKSDCSFMIRIFNRIQTFLDNNPTLDAEYTIFLNEMKTITYGNSQVLCCFCLSFSLNLGYENNDSNTWSAPFNSF